MCGAGISPMSTSSTERSGIEVLLAADHFVAVSKPVGMPTQPDPTGDRSLLAEVEAWERSRTPRSHIGMPHRIDRPVSGVVLFTRTRDALVVMNELFRSGRVSKTYYAIVEGRTPNEGVCENVLEQDARSRRSRVVEKEGTASRLSYRTLAHGDRFSLLEVIPDGGAFHQIRAQLATAGHPIKGDVKYGARRGEPDRSIALHARSLTFEHPLFGGRVHIEAPPPITGVWPAFVRLAQGRSGQ
jgi:23S rRNA pseudouridine1911/1915/1917 synthase